MSLEQSFSVKRHSQVQGQQKPDFIFESCTIVKDSRSDVITSDLSLPGIDVAADAHRLLSADRSFAGAVMLDVLHHLERPIEFLTAVARPAACRRVEAVIPALRVRSVEWLSPFAYPMSGGFQKWSLMPAALVGPVLSLEEKIPEAVRRLIAFRMMVVLERVKP